MNEVVLCEENSWLPIPGLLTVLELHQYYRSVNGGLTGISVVRVNPKNHLMLLCK